MSSLISFEMLLLVTALFLLTEVSVAQTVNPEVDEAQILEQGRQYTQQFYDGALNELVPKFSEALSELIGGEEGLRTFRGQVLEQLGAEVKVLDEQVSELPGRNVYRRYAQFENLEQTILVEWTFTDNMIEGFQIRLDTATEAPSNYLEYQTKSNLRLPFDGEWFVFWGGRTVAQNYHAAFPDQRFAYDFVVVQNGKTHQGEGTANEDYFCYGLDIVASAAGVVVVAVDGIADQTPGEMNAEQPLGNYVILDHQNGEFSFLAHLQQGSVAVRKGAEVKAGDALGHCGNSGNSSEPHLHYHLQTTAVSFAGEGLPAQFQNYLADAANVVRGEPVQGQIIRQP
jgi:murein DD-endopeptidase MepM/ murein hydrolase activator NlpD